MAQLLTMGNRRYHELDESDIGRVQLYRIVVANRQLKGFDKVFILSGQTLTVKSLSRLRIWDCGILGRSTLLSLGTLLRLLRAAWLILRGMLHLL